MGNAAFSLKKICNVLIAGKSIAAWGGENPVGKIPEILDRLVSVYNPAFIYLYGSFAWGQPEKESDLDFFVILQDSSQKHAERIRTGLRALKGIQTNVDILVFTENEIASRRNHPSTLAYKVLNKGIKLYEAA